MPMATSTHMTRARPSAHRAVVRKSQRSRVGVPAPSASTSTQPAGLGPFKALVQEKRFTCTQCGKCCTGSGEVWVSQPEIDKMAKHLNLSPNKFVSTYCKSYGRVDGWRLLRNRIADDGCIFLAADNKCRLHEVRPVQCRTYPWWPDLMQEDSWVWEKDNICEGFDHLEAGETDVEAAAAQLQEATVHMMKMSIAQGRAEEAGDFIRSTFPGIEEGDLHVPY